MMKITQHQLVYLDLITFINVGFRFFGSKGKISTNRLFTAREDFYPTINLEIAGKKNKIIELKPDNHFRKMLLYFQIQYLIKN